MSVSSVSSGTTASYTTNSQQKDVRNAFKQVADAINDNDLRGAQNAFDNLAALLNGNQQGTSSSSSSSTGQSASGGTDLATLLNQIGSALQSGDLDQAKQALQTLQQTAQSGRHHRHHHHGGGDVAAVQPTQTSSTTSASTDTSSAGSVNLTV